MPNSPEPNKENYKPMGNREIHLKSTRSLSNARKVFLRYKKSAIAVAEAIGKLAEPPLQEFESSDLLEKFLSDGRFKVTRPWKNLPTAFRAVAGTGKPKIVILAEYDALPDCGPKPGQWGHGCGHNLLGTASALGGIIAAELLKKKKTNGQVIVIGSPAEETLSGKVMLAEKRAFVGLDAVITWHPDTTTSVKHKGGQAMDSLSLKFSGKTAHAASDPHKGRSALDAAILTDVAVNYLREHIEENVRIHSVIPDGGLAPNIVPDHAELWYYIRGRDRKQVDELTRRVIQCGRGAAMATDTKARVVHHDSITERIPNWPMTNMLNAILHRCGAPKFSQADQSAADKIAPDNKKFSSEILPVVTEQEPASSDDNNVSYFAPLGRFNVACVPVDIVAHHRQFAAMCTTSGAYRGMRKAAEIMAMAAIELTMNKPLLSKAKGEFKNNKKGKKYELPHLKRKPVFKRSI